MAPVERPVRRPFPNFLAAAVPNGRRVAKMAVPHAAGLSGTANFRKLRETIAAPVAVSRVQGRLCDAGSTPAGCVSACVPWIAASPAEPLFPLRPGTVSNDCIEMTTMTADLMTADTMTADDVDTTPELHAESAPGQPDVPVQIEVVTAEAPADASGFAALGLEPRLLDSLTKLGYEEPTPVQREVIPPVLAGRDVIGQAATGTGKTAAFALPVLQRIAAIPQEDRPKPAALVLVPTRELAMQVAEAMIRYGKPLGIRVLSIYGGQSFGPQLKALARGVDVVVATPGRALDHLRRGTLQLGTLAVAVLDEADEMLDMGFADDIETVLAETPHSRQTVLVSATLPPRIAAIAARQLQDPVRIQITAADSAQSELPNIRQTAYVVRRHDKPAALGRVLDVENPEAALVFCRTRHEVDTLAETLTSRGYRAEPLHGGMSQDQRERVIKRLKGGQADLVVATDVAARGLDVSNLSHVFNYDVPSAPESYVHRIGRVGRAGREGVAITLTDPREHRLLRSFERASGQPIQVVPIPTAADLRSKRRDLTQTALRDAIAEGNTAEFRPLVESLAGEFDLMELTLAAVKLAHQALTKSVADEPDFFPVTVAQEERRSSGKPSGPAGRNSKFSKTSSGKPQRQRTNNGPMAKLYVTAGRNTGIRPQDLVGAIANESGISGRTIGAIEIAERFSLVEVPEGDAEKVITALRGCSVRGRKIAIRRDAQPR